MSEKTARRLLFAGVVLFVSSAGGALVQSRTYEIPILIAFAAYVVVGGLIMVRRPGNLIGLALVAYGSLWGFVTAAIVTAESLDQAARLDAAAWVTLASVVPGAPTIWLLGAMWLVFPDGKPTTAGDRRLLWASGLYAAVLTLGGVFSTPQSLPETKPYPHPFLENDVAQDLFDVGAAAFVLLFFFQIFVAARLVRRMRHGDPIQRRQVLWIAVAVILNSLILIGNAGIKPLGTEDRAFWLIDSIAIVLIPLAVGVAIFRYRLYGIDTIVNRSATFGVLLLFIGGVYVAIVVGVGELLGGDSGFGLSIVASVLVAMAFQPVRRRVERWANRLVYGERASPYEVLVRFSRRSSELSDKDLLERIPKMLVDGTGAVAATLWTTAGGGFRAVSTWPIDNHPKDIDGAGQFEDPAADFSIPVHHDGELLGGLSLIKTIGESMTPAEEELLGGVASGLGLALRNARLTRELRNRVAELEASRQRVLVASDEARRALERDLDSGPQQQLVALKVKLGPTHRLAERAGAEKTAELLLQLERDAGAAIQAVRDLAGGIYPPLLEAEGLEVAIRQQTQGASVPVVVTAQDLGRYPREIEAAIYFAVLEALQNTAKYAEATEAKVTLTEYRGALRFEVVDDGDGFDSDTVGHGAGLTGMADRLDTVGGSLEVRSAPGAGTVVIGSVPVREMVNA